MIRLMAFALLSVFLLFGGMTAGAWFAQSLSVDDLKAGRIWGSGSTTPPQPRHPHPPPHAILGPERPDQQNSRDDRLRHEVRSVQGQGRRQQEQRQQNI